MSAHRKYAAPKIGTRIGKWVVVSEEIIGNRSSNYLRSVICRCDCGTVKLVGVVILQTGKSLRCKACYVETMRAPTIWYKKLWNLAKARFAHCFGINLRFFFTRHSG